MFRRREKRYTQNISVLNVLGSNSYRQKISLVNVWVGKKVMQTKPSKKKKLNIFINIPFYAQEEFRRMLPGG